MSANTHAHFLHCWQQWPHHRQRQRKKRQTPPAPEMSDAYRSTRHHSSAGATTSTRVRPTVKSMTTTKSTQTESFSTNYARDGGAASTIHPRHEQQRKQQWSHFCMINALAHRHRDPHHRQRKEQWSHFCMNNALAHQRLDVHTVVALSESGLRCNRAPTVLLSERLGTQDQIPYSVEQPTAKARSPALFQATPWCRDRSIVMLWPPNSKTTLTKTHSLVTVKEAMTSTQARQTEGQAHCLIHLRHRC